MNIIDTILENSTGYIGEKWDLGDYDVNKLYEVYKKSFENAPVTEQSVTIELRELAYLLDNYIAGRYGFCDLCESLVPFEDGPCICYAR